MDQVNDRTNRVLSGTRHICWVHGAIAVVAGLLVGAGTTWVVTEGEHARLRDRVKVLEGSLAEAKRDADYLAWTKTKWREEMNLRLQIRDRQVAGRAAQILDKKLEEANERMAKVPVLLMTPELAMQLTPDTKALYEVAKIEAEAEFPFPEVKADASSP